jgi:hypothetical protein
MRRVYLLVGLLVLAAPLLAGCLFPGFAVRTYTATAVLGPGRPPGAPPTPSVPVIQIEYNGGVLRGVLANYEWSTPNYSGSGSNWGGRWPPPFPGTLGAPAGQSVDIVIGGSAPATVTVSEINSQGVPVAATVFAPASSRIAYPLARTGRYGLQVVAQWAVGQQATYYFEVDVGP